MGFHTERRLVIAMFVIRKKQMEALTRYMERGFENRVLEFLRQEFPEDVAIRGEHAVRGSIRYGIERARHHGFSREPDILRFIKLMYMLGRNFDTDPVIPWAAEILDDSTIPVPWKMDELYEEAECRIADANENSDKQRS